MMRKIKTALISRMVTIIFVIIVLACFILADMPMTFYMRDIISRLSRNLFLILALIIPVIAGMGLNFAIVLGAMAGQIAIIFIANWGISGMLGVLAAFAVSVPFAILFGWLIGRLLNKTKGQEMITSLILGYFANGIYQFVLLLLVGTLIPLTNKVLVLSRGYGIKNTVDLEPTIRHSIDYVWQLPVPQAFLFGGLITLAGFAFAYYRGRKRGATLLQYIQPMGASLIAIIAGLVWWNTDMVAVKVPMLTFGMIALLCLFYSYLLRTKLGQDFKAVGMNQHVAKIAGIEVDKVRIKAIMISIVLAAIGQIIFLQNLGNLNTYGSHGQVGVFAVAAILIGGASVARATVGQAILGAILFHSLFMLSPIAGRNLLGDAQLGEYFRAFVAYGVIALSLGMHAYKRQLLKKRKEEEI